MIWWLVLSDLFSESSDRIDIILLSKITLLHKSLNKLFNKFQTSFSSSFCKIKSLREFYVKESVILQNLINRDMRYINFICQNFKEFLLFTSIFVNRLYNKLFNLLKYFFKTVCSSFILHMLFSNSWILSKVKFICSCFSFNCL